MKRHWENVYERKTPDEMSWTQPVPLTSLQFVKKVAYDRNANIIDVGGGDSTLVDHLLEAGYQKITVLDVSSKALQRAQQRLGRLAANVKWIEADVTTFKPTEYYDVWHDRAVFHFLTTESQAQAYIDIVKKSVKGHLIMGTFSETGPNRCSGLPVKQYTEATLAQTLDVHFEKIKCHTENHTTPFNTIQNFLFCNFKKRTA